jgi:hypothetical protein
MGKHVNGFRLGNISGMHHLLYTGTVKEVYDPATVIQIIVRIRDDTYSHESSKKQKAG